MDDTSRTIKQSYMVQITLKQRKQNKKVVVRLVLAEGFGSRAETQESRQINETMEMKVLRKFTKES
jgi:hypothetical protein